MSSSSKYLEQFERVKRWYERFERINEGREHDRSSDYYQDEVYAFFLNCYHLKDWIENDESVGDAAVEKVKKFIKNNEELILCGHICDGLKHLKLTRPKRPTPRVVQRKYHLQLGGPETIISVKYKFSFDTSSGPVDAFELATKCLQAWENFIIQVHDPLPRLEDGVDE